MRLRWLASQRHSIVDKSHFGSATIGFGCKVNGTSQQARTHLLKRRFGEGFRVSQLGVVNAGLIIADVTNPPAMFTVSKLEYSDREYCHQGWVSKDLQYVFVGDELDETRRTVGRTTTYVVDVSNLSMPTLASTFEHDACNIDHNMMVHGDYLYQANYAAGLRVLDFTSPPNLTAFAHFDTRPEDNVTDFVGAWGMFTDYASGIVVLSDLERGLFIFGNSEPPPVPLPIPSASDWGLCSRALLLLGGWDYCCSTRPTGVAEGCIVMHPVHSASTQRRFHPATARSARPASDRSR